MSLPSVSVPISRCLGFTRVHKHTRSHFVYTRLYPAYVRSLVQFKKMFSLSQHNRFLLSEQNWHVWYLLVEALEASSSDGVMSPGFEAVMRILPSLIYYSSLKSTNQPYLTISLFQ